MNNLWSVGPSYVYYPNDFGYFKREFNLTIYLNVGDIKSEDGMGSAATNSRLHTAVTSCPGWPGTGSPATNAVVDK